MRDPDLEQEREVDPADQLSLFSAIAAVPLDEQGRPLEPSSVIEEPAEDEGEEVPGLAPDELEGDIEGDSFQLTAPEFDSAIPTPEPVPESEGVVTPRTRKRKLRELNSARVRWLVHRTRLSHAKVNAELNQRVGIQRITEATVLQLERRLEVADTWLSRLR